jgi:hypothetical protein
MRFEIRHRFDCTPERLWDLVLDEGYQAAIDQRAALNREVLESRATPDGRFHRIRFVPERSLPSAMQKVLGTERLSYVQEQTWRARDHSMRWRVILDAQAVASRFKSGGDFKIQARAGDTCERVVAGEVSIAVPIMGGRMEKKIIDELTASYQRAAEVTVEFLSA